MTSPPDRVGVALVTGASSGFGRLIAERLSEDGFRTFGTSRSPKAEQGGVEMLELDVRDASSVEACVANLRERAGAVDVLVNNAGVLSVGPSEEHALPDVRDLFETNFFGVVRMVNAVLPGMRERRRGRIVNIGSLAGLLAVPGEAAYAASKFAVEGYSEALSYEVAPFGISVSIVEPGFFQTGIGASAQESGEPIPDYDSFRAAIQKSVAGNIDGGGDPTRVADLVSRVVSARRPRLRYRVGMDAVWLPRLRHLLPHWAFAMGVRREFGL